MTPALALFASLLAVELVLLGVALRGPARLAGPARIAACLVPLTFTLALRGAQAFSTHAVLEWDETYYLSLAVTAAGGGGLYPYIYGFGPMHIMGGMGYAAYSYALAVKAFGPTILALRLVSLFASVAGLAGIWTLVRRWYGSGPAWLAIALTAPLQLFALSNTARMDSWTFAYAAWALVAAATAFDRWHERRWHLLVGVIFALGLEVHIDTIATAMACGVVYLIRYLREAIAARRVLIPAHPMFLYLAGLLAGLALYVCVNIVPDAASYYVTTVMVRVDATSSYSRGTSSILGSFLNPQILLAKEAARYRQLFAVFHPLEIGLAIAAIAALVIRRNPADRLVLVLVPAVVAAAAVVLNNASPLYYIHVLPALVVPLAPLFSHGFTGQARVPLSGMRPAGWLAFGVVCCALSAVTGAKALRAIAQAGGDAPPSEHVRQARALVRPGCKVAGNGGLYVQYFSDYPRFVSHRDTEVTLGMLYYRTTDEAAYWQIQQPDAVIAAAAMRPALAAYVERRHLIEAAPGIWLTPGGCTGRR